MAKLEIALLAGASTKQFLTDFEKLIVRMEKASGMKASKVNDDDEPEEVEETEEEADEPAPKKKSKKAAAPDDDEEEAEEPEETEEEEETEEVDEDEDPAPKKKSKKITLEDVNQACKARAARTSFPETKALLKKKFKTSSVSELKETQWADVIKAMKA